MAIKQYSLMADGNRRLAPDFKVRELRCKDGTDTVMVDEALTVVLQSVGFPLEAIAIIVAIDKFPDMFKTVLNVLGDSVDTVIVAKSEGEFDADVFNGLKEADVNVGE